MKIELEMELDNAAFEEWPGEVRMIFAQQVIPFSEQAGRGSSDERGLVDTNGLTVGRVRLQEHTSADLAATIARMKTSSETEMTCDDAIMTLDELIASARRLQ